MKLLIFLFSGLFFVPAQASVQLTKPLRWERDGTIAILGHDNAERDCAVNYRLPTAREYAEVATTMGATGIRETAFPSQPYNLPAVASEVRTNRGEGYNPVFKTSETGAIAVDFYFNNSGYVKPAGDLGTYYYWTASSAPVMTDNRFYAFAGDTGAVDHPIPDGYENVFQVATRCAFK